MTFVLSGNDDPGDALASRSSGGLFTFLFASRGVGWLIALLVVVLGDRPDHNVGREPWLLIASALLVLAGTLYVPLARPHLATLRRRLPRPHHDLLLVSAVDLVAVFVLLYLSGGYNTPYYHYAVVALLIPTALLGWFGSLTVLGLFLAALVGTWAVAGLGTDGPPWKGGVAGDSVPGVILTPVLVVLVGHALFWLMRRLELGQRRTALALERTEALYRIAQAVGGGDSTARLIDDVLRITASTGCFASLEVWRNAGDEAHLVAAAPQEAGAWDTTTTELRWAERNGPEPARLSLVAADGVERPALPILVDARPWGALVSDPPAEGLGHDERALLRAVAGQLSLGLTRLALSEERTALAAQEERARIAREIHDGIAQSIYMLSLSLERAAEMAEEQPALSERLRSLVGVAKEALLEVRQYIFDLKPLLAGEASLTGAIGAQMREFSAVTELDARLEVEGREPELPVAVAGALYRLVQEALANAYRHARPSHVVVRLEFGRDRVDVLVQDDGAGFDVERAHGSGVGGRGLPHLRERVSELSGDLRIESTPGRGTSVAATLPLTAAPEPVGRS